MRKLLFVSTLSILLLMIISCIYSHSSHLEKLKKIETPEINDKNNNNIGSLDGYVAQKPTDMKENNSNNPITFDESFNTIYESIKNTDFSIREFPINYELYDSETDKIYKEAYYNAVTNEVPLRYWDTNEEVSFIELFRGRWQDNDEFQRFLIKSGDYHYFDYDGDGLPELVITEGQGSIVLKYKSKESQVYYYAGFTDGWRILGSRQMYYYSSSSANRVLYCYISLDENGIIDQEVIFDSISVENGIGWSKEYFVSVNKSDKIRIEHDNWDEVTKNFFMAIDKALPAMPFEEVFGESMLISQFK